MYKFYRQRSRKHHEKNIFRGKPSVLSANHMGWPAWPSASTQIARTGCETIAPPLTKITLCFFEKAPAVSRGIHTVPEMFCCFFVWNCHFISNLQHVGAGSCHLNVIATLWSSKFENLNVYGICQMWCSWFSCSPPARWELLDFMSDARLLLLCQLLVTAGLAGPPLTGLDRSGRRRTSSASSWSQWASPDLHCQLSSAVGLAGLQPARVGALWALPDLNRTSTATSKAI